jgi:hypothetical protein
MVRSSAIAKRAGGIQIIVRKMAMVMKLLTLVVIIVAKIEPPGGKPYSFMKL